MSSHFSVAFISAVIDSIVHNGHKLPLNYFTILTNFKKYEMKIAIVLLHATFALFSMHCLVFFFHLFVLNKDRLPPGSFDKQFIALEVSLDKHNICSVFLEHFLFTELHFFSIFFKFSIAQ